MVYSAKRHTVATYTKFFISYWQLLIIFLTTLTWVPFHPFQFQFHFQLFPFHFISPITSKWYERRSRQHEWESWQLFLSQLFHFLNSHDLQCYNALIWRGEIQCWPLSGLKSLIGQLTGKPWKNCQKDVKKLSKLIKQ